MVLQKEIKEYSQQNLIPLWRCHNTLWYVCTKHVVKDMHKRTYRNHMFKRHGSGIETYITFFFFLNSQNEAYPVTLQHLILFRFFSWNITQYYKLEYETSTNINHFVDEKRIYVLGLIEFNCCFRINQVLILQLWTYGH